MLGTRYTHMAGSVCVLVNEGSQTQRLYRDYIAYIAQRTQFATNR